MMDVVTGAMGAFLIVMVVLARYYESDPANKENVEALQAELSSARDRLREIDSALRRAGVDNGDAYSAISRATRNLEDAETDAENLREQLDQAEAEIDRKDERIRSLQSRRGFAVTSTWACAGVDVDVYVWDTQTSAKDGSPAPYFDPGRTQWHNWTGDFRSDFGDRGIDVWLVGSSVANTTHKVYIKLANPAAVASPCRVTTVIVAEGFARSYERILSRTEPWIYLAQARQNSDLEQGDFEFFDPTETDSEAERREVARRRASQ